MFNKRHFLSLFVAGLALFSVAHSVVAQDKTPAKPAAPAAVPAKPAKKMPARDPKTGKFIKKTPAVPAAMKKMAPKMAGKKPLPPRDPKTGRFMKKPAAAPAAPAAAPVKP